MTLVFFVAAAFFEIAGCFAFWSYFRLGRPAPAWRLGCFADPVRVCADTSRCGLCRTGLRRVRRHIRGSVVGMARVVEGVRPDRWDLTGATICVVGALVIVFGRR